MLCVSFCLLSVQSGAKSLAFLYASHCATLAYPKDAVLWVQAAVYEWQCLMYTGLSGLHVKGKSVEGYTALLRALQKKPGDSAMIQARTAYQQKLSKDQQKKAECVAGVVTAEEDKAACAALLGATAAAALPCVPAGGDAPASVLSRMSNDPQTPEQSNFGVDLGNIPASLRQRYATNPTFVDPQAGRSRIAIVIVAMVATAVLVCALFAISKTRMCATMQLKLFGGKRSGAGGAASHGHSSGGDKFV